MRRDDFLNLWFENKKFRKLIYAQFLKRKEIASVL